MSLIQFNLQDTFLAPFHPAHMFGMDLQERQSESLFMSAPDKLEYGYFILSKSQNPISWVYKDKVLLIGGVAPIYSHVADGFFLFHKEFKTYFRKHAKTIIRNILIYLDENKYDRVQTLVREDFVEAQRFVEFLGFKKEGLLHKILPDKSNAYMYARVM